MIHMSVSRISQSSGRGRQSNRSLKNSWIGTMITENRVSWEYGKSHTSREDSHLGLKRKDFCWKLLDSFHWVMLSNFYRTLLFNMFFNLNDTFLLSNFIFFPGCSNHMFLWGRYDSKLYWIIFRVQRGSHSIGVIAVRLYSYLVFFNAWP